MSLCIAVPHSVVPQKKDVAFLQHPMVSIISIVVIFLKMCGIYATPCSIKSDQVLNPTLLTQISRASPASFEPLWTPWSLWASLNALKAIEPHWRSLKPAFHWTLWLDRPGVVFQTHLLGLLCFRVSQIYHWSHYSTTVYLVTELVWSNPLLGAPHLVYLLIYTRLANVSTKNKAIFSRHNI